MKSRRQVVRRVAWADRRGPWPARVVGLALGLVLVPGLVWAGDPIRFVRPRADEKAPLRVNYSAEKAQAKDLTEPGATLGGSAVPGAPRVGSAVAISRRGRDGAARKGWEDSGAGAGGAAEAERMRLQVARERFRMSEAAAEEAAGRGSLFSSPSAFGTAPSLPSRAASGGGEAAGATASADLPGAGGRAGLGGGNLPRSWSDLGIRNMTAAEALPLSGRSALGGGLAPASPAPASTLGGAGLGAPGGLRPGEPLSADRAPGVGFDTLGNRPFRPEAPSAPADAPGRPLRSTFDLPSRPR